MNKLFTLLLLMAATIFASAQTPILQEDFEGGSAPAGWTQMTSANDGGWKFGTATALSSSYFPIPSNGTRIAGTNDDACNCDKGLDRLITPELNFSGYNALLFQFDLFYAKGTYQGIVEKATIDYSTDGGATWNTLTELSGDGTGWQNAYRVNLSALAGDSSVLISFTYLDAGGWLYGCAIDNVKITAPADHDVAISKLDVARYAQFGSAVSLSGEVTNFGGENLTSYDVTWTDGINNYTDQITGIDVPFLGTTSFTHSSTLSLPQAVTYDYTISVESPNGSADGNPTDNALSGKVSGVTYIPNKKAVGEEGTGTWCGWCPRGTDWMEFMTINYPQDFIGIAVHNGDPMVVTAYDNGMNFSAFPNARYDRIYDLDPSELQIALPDFKSRIAPIAPDIEATLDVATMTLSADVSAEFVTQLDNLDMQFSVILTEDQVHGTATSYGQSNYYNGQSDPLPGYGYDWHTLPATVPASTMYYDHVARALIGGFSGEAGSIPAAVMAGQVVEKTYSMPNFNKNWQPLLMHAIVLVLDGQTGECLNAETTQLNVICPADFGATIDVVDSSPAAAGSITVNGPSPTFGFGGYTYLWGTGETTPNLNDVLPGTYTLVITDKIGCQQTVDVVVGGVNSTQEIESLTSMAISPNPASDRAILSLEFNETVDLQIEVVNQVGQQLYLSAYSRTNGGKYPLDLSTFSNGVYFVKASVDGQVSTRRLLVSK